MINGSNMNESVMNDSNMDESGMDVSAVDNDGEIDQESLDDGEGQGFIDCGSFFQVNSFSYSIRTINERDNKQLSTFKQWAQAFPCFKIG